MPGDPDRLNTMGKLAGWQGWQTGRLVTVQGEERSRLPSGPVSCWEEGG